MFRRFCDELVVGDPVQLALVHSLILITQRATGRRIGASRGGSPYDSRPGDGGPQCPGRQVGFGDERQSRARDDGRVPGSELNLKYAATEARGIRREWCPCGPTRALPTCCSAVGRSIVEQYLCVEAGRGEGRRRRATHLCTYTYARNVLEVVGPAGTARKR